MPERRMLRAGQIDGARFFTIDAGRLPDGRWEAWLACARITFKTGAGTLSDTLKVGATLDELQSWADALSFEALTTLALKQCPDL